MITLIHVDRGRPSIRRPARCGSNTCAVESPPSSALATPDGSNARWVSRTAPEPHRTASAMGVPNRIRRTASASHTSEHVLNRSALQRRASCAFKRPASIPAGRFAVTLGNVQRDGLRCAPSMRTGVDPSRYAVLSHARSSARPSRQTRWPHAMRRASHDRFAGG